MLENMFNIVLGLLVIVLVFWMGIQNERIKTREKSMAIQEALQKETQKKYDKAVRHVVGTLRTGGFISHEEIDWAQYSGFGLASFQWVQLIYRVGFKRVEGNYKYGGYQIDVKKHSM